MVNIGYAWAQLARARQTAAEHADPDVRTRALAAVAKWEATIEGMQRGTIDVGSRTPTSAPAWVTLEVATGGFATGAHSAGGPLRDHEEAMAARLGVPATRTALNLAFLESESAHELFSSGRYRIDVPEEGALLVVAWLRARGEVDRAGAIVEAIAPWFETLRFYPVPVERAAEVTAAVRLQDLGATVDTLDNNRRQPAVEAMRATVLVWTPLRDRAVALFADTRLPDWHARVAQLVADAARAEAPHTERARDTSELIAKLARLASGSLTAAERREVDRVVTRHIAAHGAPGSPEHTARRASEVMAVAGPLHADLRRILLERLRRLPRDGGVDLETAGGPVTSEEAARFNVPAGTALPPYMLAKLARSSNASVEELIAQRVIPSSEMLARVLPQVTGQVRAETIGDAQARRLYTMLYSAFRRRRGLLLLHYQHQVRFHELPWVAALEAARDAGPDAAGRARRVASSASGAALRGFPHTITPNKLVTELYALCAAADLRLPLVEELAADIFMGSFTKKFVEAAVVAAHLLADTLYERYYAIDTAELAALPTSDTLSPAFAALCERRAAAVGSGAGYGVARNGKIIEQSQILTTHNLAVLYDALDLRDRLDVRSLAERCFRWIVRQLMIPARSGHEILVRFKNTAYAWRQMVFFLSFAPDASDFVRWARTRVARDAAFATRFEPAIRGLELAVSGIRSSAPEFASGGGRVFTGWSTERHWLSPR